MRGGVDHATNNRMELTAILNALSLLKRRTRIEIRTDSKFSISVCTEWRRGWKRRGWTRANGEPPVNLDVIQQLDAVLDQHDVHFTWVRGHDGEPGNEYVDDLCNQAIDAVVGEGESDVRERLDAPPFDVRVS